MHDVFFKAMDRAYFLTITRLISHLCWIKGCLIDEKSNYSGYLNQFNYFFATIFAPGQRQINDILQTSSTNKFASLAPSQQMTLSIKIIALYAINSHKKILIDNELLLFLTT